MIKFSQIKWERLMEDQADQFSFEGTVTIVSDIEIIMESKNFITTLTWDNVREWWKPSMVTKT